MRLTMHARGCFSIRGIDETEASGPLGVIPIGHVFDPVLILNFQVLAVRFRNVLRRRSGHVVAVHEDRHAPTPSFLASRSGSDVLVDAEQVLRVKFGFDSGEALGVTQVGPPNAILVVLRYEVYVSAAGRERGTSIEKGSRPGDASCVVSMIAPPCVKINMEANISVRIGRGIRGNAIDCAAKLHKG